MELQGIHTALQQGLRLRAFLSGGGLRVIRLEDGNENLKGYGEHPLVNDALMLAEEDFLAGGRPYKEVYGKKYTHYMTGTTEAPTRLDEWLLRGRSFNAWWENEEFVVELHGTQDVRPPKELIKQVEETGQSVEWEQRGYKYLTSPYTFPGNGEKGTSMRCLNPPPSSIDHLVYNFTQTGRDKTLLEALNNAFKGPQVEVTKN